MSIKILYLCSMLLFTNFVHAKDLSPADVSAFQKEIFADSKGRCLRYARTMKELKDDPYQLKTTVADLIKQIQSGDFVGLHQRFHPRLKLSAREIRRLLDRVKSDYGDSFDLSIYRVWALSTRDGEATPLECPEDELSFGPHYGYDLQFAVWLQVTGPQQVGRILLTLVPFQGWSIGVWHAQQWTYLNLDADRWIASGIEAKAKKQAWQAYVYLDIATKLLDGAGYLFLQKHKDAVATRDDSLKASDALLVLQKELDPRIIDFGSIFAKDGPGYFLRMKIDAKANTKVLRDECRSILSKMYNNSMFVSSDFGGSRCSFVSEQENPKRDGRLGGVEFLRKNL